MMHYKEESADAYTALGFGVALSVHERIPPRKIDGRDIRHLLNRDGALLD
jgi:hypothetical protein